VLLPDSFARLIRSRCRFIGPADSLDPDASLADLGVDSLELVELIVDIEDTYGIEVPLEILTPEMFASPGTIWLALRDMITEGDREMAGHD
jgi:acyl carrier protein